MGRRGQFAVRRILAAAGLVLASGCSQQDDQAPWLGEVVQIASPAASGSRYPHLAAGTDGSIVMSWLRPAGGQRHVLEYALLQDASWSPPAFAAAGDDWFVNWADFPSVVPGPDGLLVAHWLQQTPVHTYSYDLRLAVSGDSGRSWSASMTPHDDGTPTEHGFATLVPLAGSVLAVWLDGRHTVGSGNHDHAGAGAMTLRAQLVDRAGRFSGGGTEIDGRVCDCCQTDVALTSAGAIVAYRDRSPAEIRDIAVARFADGEWTQPALVHADGWHMTGCPVNGPAIDADGSAVVVAWFTAPDRPRIRLAFSADGGASFDPPVEVAAGSLAGRVDVVLLDDGRAVVSWLGDSTDGTQLLVQPFTRDGAAGPRVVVARSSAERSSGFPQMIRAGQRLVFAWTEAGDPPSVRTATATLR